jgi:hypothetical protein
MRLTPSTRLAAALGIALITAACSTGTQESPAATSGAPSQSTGTTMAPSSQQAQTPGTAPAVPSSSSPAPSVQANQTAMLQYLMEEEKMAHDVYQRFHQLWGSGVFDNIESSETTHQQLLLPVLQAKGIPDPRTGQPGTFKDARIQQMYNQLTQEGARSVTDAYRAGVTIEEQDIADLQADLKTTTDPAVVSALQRLLAGSQNHLQSFQAHLG